MASITEHIIKLEELTQTNLEILQAINDSFFTKQNHLTVNIGDVRCAMPSFISLENKINSLTANFENLINSPENGEAYFNFDGNSRAIQVRPYTNTPNSLELQPVNEFGVDNNNIFKDFMTPHPSINLNVQSLPNDIVQVVVKKIIPKNTLLVDVFKEYLSSPKNPSAQCAYKDLYKKLALYKKDTDYTEYDTIVNMPIRKNIGSGTYVIDSILNDEVDENLDNYITIKLRSNMTGAEYCNSLKYRLFDETIERPLKVGDQLTTYDGLAKMEIVELRNNTNTIKIRVMHGEFLNLIGAGSESDNISSLSKIKFFSPIDFDEDKYIKVGLEEDKYIFVAVAALNNRMNVQSSWGTGLVIDTHSLMRNEQTFEDYYNKNVRNVGDVLYEITSMMPSLLNDYSKDEYLSITKLSPIIDVNDLIVTQINSHLNDSTTVQNIRSYYSQKSNFQDQLQEVQLEIDEINKTLSSISFDDTTDIRASYTSKLAELTNKKNEITTSIIKLTNNISNEANNSEVPIENAKYRIRGFYDYESFLEGENSWLKDHVRGIQVQYRYKNVDKEQGSSMSINGKFVFSDWNVMDNFNRERITSYDNGYKVILQPNNDESNEPSFNQIDIPISQGETVDIRLKLIYDFAWPFATVYSDWSPIVNIKFPIEFLKDVKILDIIEENNNDIETNRFNNIINDNKIPDHINDKIIDQDITYFHKPDNISSGFYTEERRVIPLKDKLLSMDALITEIRDEVMGSNMESLMVSIKHGTNIIELNPYQKKNILVEQYSTFATGSDTSNYDGIYTINNDIVSTIFNISIVNKSDHTVKLFSMFPGDRSTQVNDLVNNKYTKTNYTTGKDFGVWFKYSSIDDDEKGLSIQSGNQFIYFRVNDINTGTLYYGGGNQSSANNKLSLEKGYISLLDITKHANTIACMYPSLYSKYGLCINSDGVGAYISLKPYEELLIPVVFEYKVAPDKSISKTMSFEILPSLYKEPSPYTFTITAKYDNTTQDRLNKSNNNIVTMGSMYNPIIK